MDGAVIILWAFLSIAASVAYQRYLGVKSERDAYLRDWIEAEHRFHALATRCVCGAHHSEKGVG